jgi:hypothetical protein
LVALNRHALELLFIATRLHFWVDLIFDLSARAILFEISPSCVDFDRLESLIVISVLVQNQYSIPPSG